MHPDLKQARDAFDLAYFGGASSETILAAQHELMALEAQYPTVKAKSLRTKAIDLRAAYARHMTDYGREIGRAQVIKDPTIAKLVESAAKAALDEASECLIRALAAEDEADAIDSSGFVTLFDGVSIRSPLSSTSSQKAA